MIIVHKPKEADVALSTIVSGGVCMYNTELFMVTNVVNGGDIIVVRLSDGWKFSRPPETVVTKVLATITWTDI